MQHDLPIFVSIDGSLDDLGITTVSISIVARDIKMSDDKDGTEWQNRPQKTLLIHSWQLPKQWGTSIAIINRAETLGFILGEYTIPTELPFIYITDSNNARTLQQKCKNDKNITHWKKVRNIKQGIDYSIANHLEHLTSQWLHEDQLSLVTRRLYQKGEAIYKIWVNSRENIFKIHEINSGYNSQQTIEDDDMSKSSDLVDSTEAILSVSPYKLLY
jgi:hypothetical protein